MTTAEIIAELRLHGNLHPILGIAADRLADLDPDGPKVCNNRQCDHVLPPYRRGVRRLYCSETCRWDCYHTPSLRRVATTSVTS